MNKILEDFDKRFEKTAPNIKSIGRKEIEDTFIKHIYDSEKIAIEISEQNINTIYETKIKTYGKVIILNSHFEQNIKQVKDELELYIKNTPWLECIKNRYIIKLLKQYDELELQLLIEFGKEKDRYNNYINQQAEIIKTFIANNNPISEIYINDIYLSFNKILEKIDNKYQDDIISKIRYSVPSISINCSINSDLLFYNFPKTNTVLAYNNSILKLIENTDILKQFTNDSNDDNKFLYNNMNKTFIDEFFRKR
jgi:hypothetical protein